MEQHKNTQDDSIVSSILHDRINSNLSCKREIILRIILIEISM